MSRKVPLLCEAVGCQVLTVLQLMVLCPLPPLLAVRVLEEAALVAKDTVVCGFQGKNSDWTLVVWRSWGCSELEVFYQSYEKLNSLEVSMRKRR